MLKKIDVLFVVTGALGVGTLAQLALEHIDRTEESKKMRVFKKVGIYAGCFAAGSLIASTLGSGNLAQSMFDGKFTITEIIAEN